MTTFKYHREDGTVIEVFVRDALFSKNGATLNQLPNGSGTIRLVDSGGREAVRARLASDAGVIAWRNAG